MIKSFLDCVFIQATFRNSLAAVLGVTRYIVTSYSTPINFFIVKRNNVLVLQFK